MTQEQPQDRAGRHGLRRHAGASWASPTTRDEAMPLGHEVMGFIHDEAQRGQRGRWPRERGVFPNFEGSICDGHGGARVRNATVTTIAPTGTISIIAGCSSGIEPLFALRLRPQRHGRHRAARGAPGASRRSLSSAASTPTELDESIADGGGLHGHRRVPDDVKQVFVTAHDVTPEWHIRMQAAFQDHTDNAVSKTVNFPNAAHPEDVERGLPAGLRAGLQGRHHLPRRLARGAGAQRRRGQGRSAAEQAPSASATARIAVHVPGRAAQPLTGRRPRRGRPAAAASTSPSTRTTTAPARSSPTWARPAGAPRPHRGIGRLISLAFRYGVPPEKIVKQLKGIRCHVPSGFGSHQTLLPRRHRQGARAPLCQGGGGTGRRCPRAAAFARRGGAGRLPGLRGLDQHEGGCVVCRLCGYSKCG